MEKITIQDKECVISIDFLNGKPVISKVFSEKMPEIEHVKRKYTKKKGKKLEKIKKKAQNYMMFWTVEDKKKILEDEKNGKSPSETAKELGRTRKSVKLALWKLHHTNWLGKIICHRGLKGIKRKHNGGQDGK